jgi:hypothetical protein
MVILVNSRCSADEPARSLTHDIEVIHVPYIYDPLTEITGLTRQEIESSSLLLDEARFAVSRLFAADSIVIVGQFPLVDIT